MIQRFVLLRGKRIKLLRKQIEITRNRKDLSDLKLQKEMREEAIFANDC